MEFLGYLLVKTVVVFTVTVFFRCGLLSTLFEG